MANEQAPRAVHPLERIFVAYDLYAEQKGITGDDRIKLLKLVVNHSAYYDACIAYAEENGITGKERETYLADIPRLLPLPDITSQLVQVTAQEHLQQRDGIDGLTARRYITALREAGQEFAIAKLAEEHLEKERMDKSI